MLQGPGVIEPADAERISIVDGNPPFEIIAGEQRIRSQTIAPDCPEWVGLVRVGADSLVYDSMLDFFEVDF